MTFRSVHIVVCLVSTLRLHSTWHTPCSAEKRRQENNTQLFSMTFRTSRIVVAHRSIHSLLQLLALWRFAGVKTILNRFHWQTNYSPDFDFARSFPKTKGMWFKSPQPKRKKQSVWTAFVLVAGKGFEPHDLRVMSPTSYQAAPPRDILVPMTGLEPVRELLPNGF